MKFDIDGEELNRLARWLDKLAPGRAESGREYLSGILIDADVESATITFSATDLESYGVGISKDAIVRESGRVIVSARLLAAIGKACGKTETLKCQNVSGTVRVVGKSATWEMPTMDNQYWPEFEMSGDLSATCNTADLVRAFTRVHAAADKAMMSPCWGGIAIEVIGGERLKIATTDGYRLAVAYVDCESFVTEAHVVVATSALERALSGSETSGDTTMSLSGGTLVVSGAGYRASVRRLAEFPKWQRLVPAELPSHASAKVDVKDLRNALACTSVIRQSDTPVVMELSLGELIVTSTSGAHGSASATCEAEITGEPHEFVALNPQYLSDILTGIDAQTVDMRFSEKPLGLVVCVPVDKSGDVMDDYLHLVRPIDLARRTKGAP